MPNDTERLDWIERRKQIVLPDRSQGDLLIWQVGNSGNFQPPHEGKNLREVIDRAIAEEKKS